MINAAIVGAGDWGQRLVASVQGRSDCIRFGGVVSRTPDRIVAFAALHELTVYSDLQHALEDPGIDAVVLATPHSHHVEQVIAAALAGKAVFVEKPFALTQQSAKAAVAACRRHNVVLAFGHNRRFLPAIQALKAIVVGAQLGVLLQVEGNFSSSSGYHRHGSGSWRASRAEAPSGGMTGLGIHLLDAMVHICGRINDVHAQSRHNVLPIDVDDATTILMRFAGGALGYLGTCFASAPYWRLQLFGSEGWAEMRGFDTVTIAMRDGQSQEQKFPPRDLERAELDAFAAAIAGTHTFPVSAEDAVHGVGVLEAIGRSAETGHTVTIA
jgi:predicted dehydrogenase